jgi:D-arabinose 1-dehydrogenase-like Zn-dependent alcohol dehydrogenase
MHYWLQKDAKSTFPFDSDVIFVCTMNSFEKGDRVGVSWLQGSCGRCSMCQGHREQYAKAMGHEVVAITGSEDKRDLARKLGAYEVLVVKENAGRELRDIGGVDIVLSTSNSMRQNSQVIEGLRPEGRLISMAAGGEEISIKPRNLFKGQLTVKGSTQNKREDLVVALDLVARKKVKPMLELYKLEEINKVLERLLEGKVRFRAVFEYNKS